MPKVNNFRQQPDLPKLEEEVLQFWQADQTFEKSVNNRSADKSYVFYDGPPFATGMPHYGHLLASTTKDVIPRYFTMKGYRVERKWGWDCHGLPIENILEKELNLPDKKAIEDYGVGNFNEACRSRVLTYANDWQKIIARIGRWVDMDNDYKTMESWYMESLWWVFKKLWERDLIYQGHKSMHICPRCSTPLSNFEVTQGYKDVKDLSVFVEFELKDPQKLIASDERVFVLAWTTTPWTLPGNVLLAVSDRLHYVLFKSQEAGKLYLMAKELLDNVMPDGNYQVVQTVSAKQLLGLEYQPLFPYFANTAHAFRVVEADFVTAEEGTGIVHVAPGFGEDDYQLGKREQIALVQHVGFDGKFTKEVTDFTGLPVKPKDDPTSTDVKIIQYLAKHGKLFAKRKVTHSYPHCWRCDTPLLNYATDSWFVRVSEFKDQLLANNQAINWLPTHMKDGRFGMWLENARDWAISRNRFWGTPLPIWKSDDGDIICVESIAQLEELSGQKITDLHKHFVDQITIEQNGKVYRRIPEVLDCWFESGAMPYASFHYPFENKESFEKNFPAEFISEGQDQTRGWFYTLHVLATALTMGKNPAIPVKKSTSSFKNVIVNGVVLAEDGKKMSKRLKNYPDPMMIVDQYGVDSLRLYLMSSAVMKAENLNFSEKEVADIRRKVFVIWWNVLSFYKMFASTKHDVRVVPKPQHLLDWWLMSRLNTLTKQVTQLMDQYDVVKASRLLMDFVDELSTWYLRQSRARIKNGEGNEQLRDQSSHVLGFALYRLAQLLAPFAPFFTELIHHNLVDDHSSIHLTDWPTVDQKLINKNLEKQMRALCQLVQVAHAKRKEQQSSLRQPLAKMTIAHMDLLEQEPEAKTLLSNELNVEVIEFADGLSKDEVVFDFTLTPELKAKGEARQLVRQIQNLRKSAGLPVDQIATVAVPSNLMAWPAKLQQQLQEQIEISTNSQLVEGEKLEIK